MLLAALLLPAGAALDRYGRRLGMLVGCVMLIASLFWSGAAGSIDMIVARRPLAVGLWVSAWSPARSSAWS